MTSTVHVEVSGLTGSGKSAVMGEIEIALKALGLTVEYGPDFQAEKNGTHADWQTALDLYQPTVVLTERNISRQPQAREEGDYDLGKRDGYEQAVQDIDLLTGGDGEYVFATDGGGCPDTEAMKTRIVERFQAREDAQPVAWLDAAQRKAVERAAMDAGAYSWRNARLAMVEGEKVIGYLPKPEPPKQSASWLRRWG